MSLRGLPLIGALVPIAWCWSYAITALACGAFIGRQYSTAGIAPLLAIIASLPLALIGSGLGRYLTRRLQIHGGHPLLRSTTRWGPLLLAATAVASSLRVVVPATAAELEATPRVVLASMELRQTRGILPEAGIVRAERVYGLPGKVSKPISWGSRRASIQDAGDELEVRIEGSRDPARIPLPGVDYVIFVDAAQVRIGGSMESAIALLITGRATGRRDLLALVSEAGELVYLQLLERHWDFRVVPLRVAPVPAGDRIFVGSDPLDVLVFEGT